MAGMEWGWWQGAPQSSRSELIGDGSHVVMCPKCSPLLSPALPCPLRPHLGRANSRAYGTLWSMPLSLLAGGQPGGGATRPLWRRL